MSLLAVFCNFISSDCHSQTASNRSVMVVRREKQKDFLDEVNSPSAPVLSASFMLGSFCPGIWGFNEAATCEGKGRQSAVVGVLVIAVVRFLSRVDRNSCRQLHIRFLAAKYRGWESKVVSGVHTKLYF
jgi:hypothetical protein